LKNHADAMGRISPPSSRLWFRKKIRPPMPDQLYQIRLIPLRENVFRPTARLRTGQLTTSRATDGASQKILPETLPVENPASKSLKS
jgi:hypothetical protein